MGGPAPRHTRVDLPPTDFRSGLERMGLLRPGQALDLEPLSGGVSSDIVRARWPGGEACVKRALAQLRVQADWRAPVERNRWEVAWMRLAAAVEPDAVPAVLGDDPEGGMFAMAWLDPERHPVWKTRLRDGHLAPATARGVGARLARIHTAAAADPTVPLRFETSHIFHAIRLEPYLLATARVHTDLADMLEGLAHTTATTRLTLVHGDVSPKNILEGPRGPVFLDAECAWHGDPAFDLAFCLNHLLLKCLWRPAWREGYLELFGTLADAYLDGVGWEGREGLEARTARLLPGLLLARVDGKSPVEYLDTGAARACVREAARTLLRHPVARLGAVAGHWRAALHAHLGPSDPIPHPEETPP